MAFHLYGRDMLDAIRELREQVNAIAVDRLRVKPKVKVTGEFWAQLTEGDGNFQIFSFLEQEGAQVLVEPISTWVAYLIRLEWAMRRERSRGANQQGRMAKRMGARLSSIREQLLFEAVQVLWSRTFSRVATRAGGLTPLLLDQRGLAKIAAPYFHELAQGGEGHMEVAKSIYYTQKKLCHMVLGVKPFGCMPSTQSDAVQARVVSAFPEMLYLPIETSGEGAIQAYSRVQMVLSEARARARSEFDAVIKQTGRPTDQLRDYVARHPELERPLYRFPKRKGLTGEAAQFAWHLHDRMNREGIRATA
jgi:predicted nucleotide-binding protein (sugar kinase/HSP70/actin superfamily)